MNKVKAIAAIAGLIALSACSDIQALGTAIGLAPATQTAVTTTTNAVTVDTSNASILTKAQATACAAQADANLLTDYLTSQGKTTAAQYSAAASQAAGVACTWQVGS